MKQKLKKPLKVIAKNLLVEVDVDHPFTGGSFRSLIRQDLEAIEKGGWTRINKDGTVEKTKPYKLPASIKQIINDLLERKLVYIKISPKK